MAHAGHQIEPAPGLPEKRPDCRRCPWPSSRNSAASRAARTTDRSGRDRTAAFLRGRRRWSDSSKCCRRAARSVSASTRAASRSTSKCVKSAPVATGITGPLNRPGINRRVVDARVEGKSRINLISVRPLRTGEGLLQCVHLRACSSKLSVLAPEHTSAAGSKSQARD